MTIARIYMKKGCLVPLHHHHNEQISICDSGKLKFMVGGQELILGAARLCAFRPTYRTAPKPSKTSQAWIFSARAARTGALATTPTCAARPQRPALPNRYNASLVRR